MRRFVLTVIFVLAASAGPLLADSSVWSSAPPSTQKLLAACDALIAKRQYLSAYRLLQGVDSPDDYILAKQIDVCFKYFGQSIGHKVFALVDLTADQTLDKLRKAEGGFTGTGIALDPPAAAAAYMKSHGDSGILHKELGDYYYDVLLRYSGRWFIPDDDIRQQVVKEYTAGMLKGFADSFAYSNLGEMELRLGKPDKAIDAFKKAIALVPNDPNYHYNLAVAYENSNNFSLAVPEAKLAIQGYKGNDQYEMDALILSTNVYLNLRDLENALTCALLAKSLSPQDYRVPQKLNLVYLMKGDAKTAAGYAEQLFDMGPANPALIQMIVENYSNVPKYAGIETFFDKMLQKYQAKEEAIGNILFHYSDVEYRLKNKSQAVQLITSARDHFKKVFPPDHQVFGVIDQRIADYNKL